MIKDQILSGYMVLDFTQAVAGPTATLLMAEMGARVIKIEIAPRGDLTRTFPFFKDGRSGCFVQYNRGKQSLCVALKTPAGLKIVKDLLPKADVVVENFTPGVMDRLGLSYETVSAINPKIVMCSISSFGQDGPLAYKSGFDTIGAAYSGVLSRIGEPEGPPPMLQSAFGDVGAGIYALAAISLALLHREHTRRRPASGNHAARHVFQLSRNRYRSVQRQQRRAQDAAHRAFRATPFRHRDVQDKERIRHVLRRAAAPFSSAVRGDGPARAAG